MPKPPDDASRFPFTVRLLVGGEERLALRHAGRSDAECAFAETLVRAEHALRADGADRRVELLYGDVLLDIAHLESRRL